jgi:hypothetical protein
MAALKLGREPAYRVAIRAGLDPTVLSKMLHGAVRVRPDDPRVHRLADSLGLRPEDAIERDAGEQQPGRAVEFAP